MMLRCLLAAAVLLALFASPFVLAAESSPMEARAASLHGATDQGQDKGQPAIPKKVDLPASSDPCATCNGKGIALLDCDHCGGDGKGPCLNCGPHPRLAWVQRDLEVLRIVDPEKAKKIEGMQAEVQASLDKLNNQLGADIGPGTRGTQRCPAGCIGGRSIINRGHDCLLCKAKGKVPCAPCKGKGELSCQVCKRKKRVKATCPECIGSGQSFPHDLESRPVTDCPWCMGKSLRNCGACEGAKEIEATCAHCAGAGKAVCKKCAGTLRLPCRPCSATGDLGGFVGRSGPCTDCKHKGFTKCTHCKRGMDTCMECLGSGTSKGPCHSCSGNTYTLCGGCGFGSSRAWLAAAERFLGDGNAKAAVEHIEVAIQRTEERHSSEYSSLVGTDTDRKKLKREQGREIKALKKRLGKAGKKQKD